MRAGELGSEFTVREDGEPTRRRALRSEFSDEEWRLVSELADHPNRLLVTATSEAGETYAEVAHETIFRSWEKLKEWINAEREFLVWRGSLEAASRAWQGTPVKLKRDALLMGLSLAQAGIWLKNRAKDISEVDRNFIILSRKAVRRSVRRENYARFLLLFALPLLGAVGYGILDAARVWNRYFVERPYSATQVQPYLLTAEREQSLKPGESFKECAKDCPEMIVVPGGSFMMGSPVNERGHQPTEEPYHAVSIARPFAVSKFEVTVGDWRACVKTHGGCSETYEFLDGRDPITGTWEDAKSYVAWFRRVTGKPYRLLTEAEYEFATRAGTQTAYPWGDAIGLNNANCNGCGGQRYNGQFAPVGSFPPNNFGLYDMVGNTWEWVEDCYTENYVNAPKTGAEGDSDLCLLGGKYSNRRVLRGGAYTSDPEGIRSASRSGDFTDSGNNGFRFGRTLSVGE
jgi:formylglycine-generating enzyme required for sulfatase activity